MNKFKMLISLMLCVSPFVNSAYAEGSLHGHISCNSIKENEDLGDKIYVHPEHIFVSYDGIFVFNNPDWMRVLQLNCDENGIYYYSNQLDSITNKCPNGHRMWCPRCGGCVVRWCTFRCKCVEWE